MGRHAKKLTVSGTEETKYAIVDLIGTVGRGLLLSFCPNRRVGSHIGHTAGSFGGEGTLHWIVSIFHIIQHTC
jgi:hypothetical protein